MKFLVFFISLSILFFSLNSLPVNHFGIAKQNLPDAMNAMTGPLIAGTGKFLSDGGLDGFNTTYSIDLTTNASNLIIDNLPFSGATFNLTTNQVLFTSSGSGLIGSNLYSLTPETWDVTLLGVVHSTKGDLRIDGLAMVEDNLYGAHEIMDDNGEAGLYIIDQSTYLATFLFSFTNLAIGGIDADQVSGTIYGLDDISKEFVEIGLDGSITPIVAYPNGETDLDGLAISPDHKAYIIPDETGSIYIYNLVTQEFETPINTPWTYLDNFSGGAFISYPIINVDSTPLSSTQFPDQLKNQNFIINNSGYSSLFWSIQEDSSTSNVCANPSDIAWLTVNPSSGSIPLGSNQPVTITYDSTDLTPGEYSGSICLTSNDASQSLIEIGITLTVSPAIYGVALGADQVGSGKPEQTIIYTIAITNTSPDVADNFDLSISSAWSAYLPNESIENLPSGESTTFTVEITVHPGAVVGAQDIATVTATSRHDSGANDNILLTSTALIAYAVDLQVSQEASGYPGDTIIYTVDITNTSPNTVDSFNLSLNSLWGAHLSIENINNLAIGETSSFSVEVSIPTDAMAFDQDIATITATSQGDLEVKDTTFLTSTVLPIYGVDLNSDQSGAAKPGEKINYLMQIVNTSPNAEDTFNIESSGNWIDVLSKTSVTLGPGGSTTFNVEIDVPPAAAIGAVDIATITATSQNNGSVVGTAYLTSTALAAYGVDLQSDGTASTEPGKTITYTIHITNVSPNAEDTFVIFVDGLWSASISEPSVTLAAGASTTFTVQVVVPINSVDGEQEITTITANSQNDPTATDIIKLTSYCSYYKMYIPSISR